MGRKLFVIGGILLAVAWGVWQKQRSVAPQTAQTEIGDTKALPTVTADQPLSKKQVRKWVPPMLTYANYQSNYGPLPKSLQGTQIPFYFQLDEQGRLTVTDALRNLFDYFLKTEGEEPHDRIYARIRELLKEQLPSPAREQALAVLEQYIALKKQEIELNKRWAEDYKASGREPELAERLRLMRELRASQMDSETYQAFYGAEDKRDNYNLKARDILADQSLTPEQQDAAIEAIEDELPAEERVAKRAERDIQHLNERIVQARAAGASDAEIFRMREAVYDAETAQRFAQADQHQANWESRIAGYREQRAGIVNSAGMSDADKQAQINNLRAQHFDALEQKRIPVIDSMMDQKEGNAALDAPD